MVSSTKYECRRSPPAMDSEVGVMCSATQCGFRVRRSKADVVEGVGCKSEIGPGKPYWNRPVGSTGALMGFSERGDCRTAAGGIVELGEPAIGVEGVVMALRSRADNSAAVAAAPVRAETLAMIARVVFDIVEEQALLEKGRCQSIWS